MDKSKCREWFEVKSDEEAREVEMKLRNKGYSMFDIYVSRWLGNDSVYHREVFVPKYVKDPEDKVEDYNIVIHS